MPAALNLIAHPPPPRSPPPPPLFGPQVEAYLRLTRIPFTVIHGPATGPYGKAPFIELNGALHADSSTIVDVLAAHFGRDLNAGLTAQQRALGHALQRMVEESAYFHLVYSRWEDDDGWASTMPAYFGRPGALTRAVLNHVVRPRFRRQCAAQGTGRLPRAVVVDCFGKDMAALSECLGEDGSFLLGTDAPTAVDVAAFGLLDSLLNTGIATCLDAKLAGFPRLAAYTRRMQQLVLAPPAAAAASKAGDGAAEAVALHH
ncbi:hypothetical protein JKP88DRAFT_163329 [Tribonema minus]|uniref:Uncharacterized protein n=1 Tax=Tribonema minus TaxID=303371 RepID=A0A836CF98_9STRA|nr:hypothetical protein JKP88DRAFT_163329 [Tribonema minus]